MEIIWPEWNYTQEVQYGRSLRGLKYKGTRPGKIIVDVREVKGHTFTQQFLAYVAKQLLPALDRTATAEVSLVCK